MKMLGEISRIRMRTPSPPPPLPQAGEGSKKQAGERRENIVVIIMKTPIKVKTPTE